MLQFFMNITYLKTSL